MIAGEPYDPLDPQLCAERERARQFLKKLNDSPEEELEQRRNILSALFGYPTDAYIQPPFFCDYGTNIRIGHTAFFNFNCVILDVAPVTIGDHVYFGPSVQVYTASHPLDAAERRRGVESGAPIAIGSDVWIGGASVLCPGVTIGDGAVIGAGSVVTRDIPAYALAVGNPCRVIRRLKDRED